MKITANIGAKYAILSFFVFFIVTIFLRMFTTSESVNLTMQQGYVVLMCLIFSLVSYLWDFKFKNLLLGIVVYGLYVLSSFVKIKTGMVLLEREIVHTLCVGVILYNLVSLLHYLSFKINNNFYHKCFKGVVLILSALILLPPFFVLGYYIVSDGHLLSSDIILTLFQTNLPEVKSYLIEQNLVCWTITFIIVIFLLCAFPYALTTLKNPTNHRNVLIFTTLFIIYLIFCIFPRLTSSFVLNMTNTVSETLNSFKNYNATKEIREQRLYLLKNILKTDAEGIYVLIVGESTTRDHMSAFGYEKKTTPWFDEMVKDNKMILFNNAYSNHVHTVPSVQFALTEQNQYSKKTLEEAYSITEIARAAGFKTYWLSNQKRFNVSDTPINTIASATDKQIWINSYIGTKTMTTYYDEQLAKVIPDLSNVKKALIVVHLMGTHAVYTDRYPAQYDKFESSSVKVDSYDNAILYNDFVLSKIYQEVSKYPHFMSYIYVSDHGEDPDNGLTHESSKFTYAMSHIPFVVSFSDKYIEKNQQKLNILRNNAQKPWTSDLLYNFMISVLNIQGVPNIDEKFDISSIGYDMPVKNLKTVHGQRNIADDERLR